MSERKNIFQIFGKLIEEALINPAIQLLEPKSRVDTKVMPDSVIPPTQIGVFWDYENFPLPKKIDPEIFFETLFPSGLNYQFVIKRVYGNPSIFPPLLLKKLEKHGFEYIQGLSTGKPSSTDFMLVSDCASQCSLFKTPIVIMIISGDADIIPLVQNLSSQGHDVRLICQEKGKISSELHRIVPLIMDRQDIINGCQKLTTALISLSQIINYIIAKYPTKKVSITDLVKELELEYLQKTVDSLTGRLMFLLNLPDYQWQYNIDGGYVSNIQFLSDIDLSTLNPEEFQQRRRSLIMKLGSEPEANEWDKYWNEFQRIVPNIKEQEKFAKTLYNSCTIPEIRSRLQNKLVQIALTHSTVDLKKLIPVQYSCSDCSKTFKSEQALIQHQIAVHKNETSPQWRCSVCSKQFQTKKALTQHQNDVHDKKRQILKICPTCGRDFKSENSFLQHQRVKHGKTSIKKIKSIKCSFCNKKFATEESKEQHIKMKHQDKSHKT